MVTVAPASRSNGSLSGIGMALRRRINLPSQQSLHTGMLRKTIPTRRQRVEHYPAPLAAIQLRLTAARSGRIIASNFGLR